MGFFNKLRKKVRGQIAPVMPMAPQPMPGDRPMATVNPVRPGTTPSPFPLRDFDPRFNPPRNQPRPDTRVPLIPGIVGLPDDGGYYPDDDRYGGGFTKRPIEKGYKVDPRRRKPRGGSSIRDAIRRSKQEQMMQQFANPNIFGQPIGNFDFGNMPNFSINDIMEMPQKPQKRSGLGGLFRRLQEQIKNQQMPQDPMMMPRTAPPVMNQMQGEPRMMMAEGRDANMVDFLNSDPQQQIFGIETRIGILENQLEEALTNNDRQAYDMIVDQINDADAQRINIMNSMNPRVDRMIESGMGSSESLDDILSDLEKKN